MTAHETDIGVLNDSYLDLVEIGRGAYGARYRGRLRDGVPVIIWLLARPLVSRITAPERFIATLERAALLRHDGLSRLISFGRTRNDGLHCAYAAGGGARESRGALLTATDLSVAGAQLARGLAVVHDSGALHGGIATDRLTTTGGATMEGSGLHAACVAGGLTPTEASIALTPEPYMGPELHAGDVADARSDIYALGASLYELLTGKPPFGGRTTSFVMATVLSEADSDATSAEGGAGGYAATPATPANPAVDAILRAIELAPEDRWGTAEAFAVALEAGRPPVVAKEGANSLSAIFKRAWFPARRSRE